MSQPSRVSVRRPTRSVVLSFIGGALVLLFGINALPASVSAVVREPAGNIVVYILYIALAGTILVFVGAVMLYLNPKKHKVWGAAVLVFSVLGILAPGWGGFVVGTIVGMIGGATGIGWRPSQPVPAAPITRICPQCGHVLEPTAKFCPNCGRAFA